MSDLENVTRLPDDFDGHVRLFPLPSLVLFPHAMQPLHIFEPRYCDLLAESLKTDSLIAMATLAGMEATASGTPAIAQTVCIGRIISHVEREDERHNILLVGIKRAQLVAEVDAGRSFRIGKVEILEDLYSPSGNARRSDLRADLLGSFGRIVPSTESVKQGLSELLSGGIELGPITDIIAHALPLSATMKLRLLSESDVDGRARALIKVMDSGQVKLSGQDSQPTLSGTDVEQDGDAGGATELPFPPPFSLN